MFIISSADAQQVLLSHNNYPEISSHPIHVQDFFIQTFGA